MKKSLIVCLFCLLGLYSCDDPYDGSTYQIYDMNPISTYLDSQPEKYSEWVAILKHADLYNAVNQASEYFTAFVPNNEAVLRYYEKRNVSSIEELGKEFAIDLAKFHIIHDSINYDKFMAGGKLVSRTLSEDNLMVDFPEDGKGGNEDVFLNNEARVLNFAYRVANGFVYELENVLTPLLESIFERFEENADQYTIFNEILEMTSWKDSLSIIYDEYRQPNGVTRKVKRNYTVLAVPDQSFRSSGIHSVNDLLSSLNSSQYGVPGSNYTAKNNQLFLYTAYHIFSGQHEVEDILSLENASSNKKLMTTLSGNILQVTEEEEDEFYLNYEAGADTVARIIVENSGLMARNGLIHQLDGWLPIWESSAPTEVFWDFLDYPEIAEYVRENETDILKYQTGGAGKEGELTLPASLGCFNAVYAPRPSSSSAYPVLKYQTSRDESNPNNWTNALLYNDQFILNLGTNGYVEMTTPALIRGKYKVTLYLTYATTMNFIRTAASGSDGGQMRFTFDNDLENKSVVGYPYMSLTNNAVCVHDWVMFEEIEFEETSNHTFRLTVLDPEASTNNSTLNYRIQLDYVHFEPILD